jgi:hypothetical protein
VVEKIMDCYLSEDKHAVLVIGNDHTELATLMTINCDELEAAVVRRADQEHAGAGVVLRLPADLRAGG